MNPKVWVIKEQVRSSANGPVPLDYSAALRYGDIEFITRTDFSMIENTAVNKVVAEDIGRFIERFDNFRDYVLLTGSPLMLFALGFILNACASEVKLLVWRREEQDYRVFKIDDTFLADRGVTPLIGIKNPSTPF